MVQPGWAKEVKAVIIQSVYIDCRVGAMMTATSLPHCTKELICEIYKARLSFGALLHPAPSHVLSLAMSDLSATLPVAEPPLSYGLGFKELLNKTAYGTPLYDSAFLFLNSLAPGECLETRVE